MLRLILPEFDQYLMILYIIKFLIVISTLMKLGLDINGSTVCISVSPT